MPRPTFIRPSSPTTAKKPPIGSGWLHELKLDGYRFQIVKTSRPVRLYGPGGTEWTRRLPGFAAAFLALRCRSAVLDGGFVLPDKNGAKTSTGFT